MRTWERRWIVKIVLCRSWREPTGAKITRPTKTHRNLKDADLGPVYDYTSDILKRNEHTRACVNGSNARAWPDVKNQTKRIKPTQCLPTFNVIFWRNLRRRAALIIAHEAAAPERQDRHFRQSHNVQFDWRRFVVRWRKRATSKHPTQCEKVFSCRATFHLLWSYVSVSLQAAICCHARKTSCCYARNFLLPRMQPCVAMQVTNCCYACTLRLPQNNDQFSSKWVAKRVQNFWQQQSTRTNKGRQGNKGQRRDAPEQEHNVAIRTMTQWALEREPRMVRENWISKRMLGRVSVR